MRTIAVLATIALLVTAGCSFAVKSMRWGDSINDRITETLMVDH